MENIDQHNAERLLTFTDSGTVDPENLESSVDRIKKLATLVYGEERGHAYAMRAMRQGLIAKAERGLI